MYKIKLLDYQVNYIYKTAAVVKGCDIEDLLCKKYGVPCVEMLYATDFDQIANEDIPNFMRERL